MFSKSFEDPSEPPPEVFPVEDEKKAQKSNHREKRKFLLVENLRTDLRVANKRVIQLECHVEEQKTRIEELKVGVSDILKTSMEVQETIGAKEDEYRATITTLRAKLTQCKIRAGDAEFERDEYEEKYRDAIYQMGELIKMCKEVNKGFLQKEDMTLLMMALEDVCRGTCERNDDLDFDATFEDDEKEED